MSSRRSRVVVLGGGAAGFFAAITAAQTHPETEVILIEKTNSLLSKVRISGGGRCNVTHACFEPKALVNFYPRGHKELLGPFSQFQPKDTIAWFEAQGVELKAEKDGRMFPTTDTSQTIIDALQNAAKKAGVTLWMQGHVEKVTHGFNLHLSNNQIFTADRLILATGSHFSGHEIAKSLGHTIIPPVPSLFTFHIPASPFKELSGISLPDITLSLPHTSFTTSGPFLITHQGFSGPAVLKLSAWAARFLHEQKYQYPLEICWAPNPLPTLLAYKKAYPHQLLQKGNPFHFPTQLWRAFLHLLSLDPHKPLNHTSTTALQTLAAKLQKDTYLIDGKSPNKEEFVTCGGVCLKEINFKNMESKLTPRLHFAGEILDIDGLTGGFNFQNAWTTGWLAGRG